MTVVSDNETGGVADEIQALSARVDRVKVGVEARAQAITDEPRPIKGPSPAQPPDDRGSGGRRSWRVLIIALVLVLLAAGATMIISSRNGSGNRVSNGTAPRNAPVAGSAPSSAAPDIRAGSPAVSRPGPGTQEVTPAPASAPGPAPTVNAVGTNAASTVVVVAGDSFWSIADRVVSARMSAPTTSDVAAYWVELVQANQGSLAQAGHPDLIYVGQTFSLP
ncbi:MAG: LysM peptidoglycan-binding domain-containing protein [Actinomycetota bacterium]|nr:LysM peptidoglycan-binding domain-containing protein [Actinomycetota bacterium]